MRQRLGAARVAMVPCLPCWQADMAQKQSTSIPQLPIKLELDRGLQSITGSPRPQAPPSAHVQRFNHDLCCFPVTVCLPQTILSCPLLLRPLLMQPCPSLLHPCPLLLHPLLSLDDHAPLCKNTQLQYHTMLCYSRTEIRVTGI